MKMDNTISKPTRQNNEQEKKETKGDRYNLNYMHNPPNIMPNLRKKKRSIQPKTNVSRVLLYDNVTQQQMLDMKLSHIKTEQSRSSKLIDLHRRSFIAVQKRRQQKFHEASVVLPDIYGSAEKSIPSSRIGSQYSSRSSRSDSRLQYELSEDTETLKLPELRQTGNQRHVIFKLKDQTGKTQVFYTVADENFFTDIVPLHSFYSKTTDDPRFQDLENVLSKLDLNTDGFNELSPSYKREDPKIPEHVLVFETKIDGKTSSPA